MTVDPSFSVQTDDAEQLVRAAEVMARAAAGLLLEGADVNLSLLHFDPDEEEHP